MSTEDYKASEEIEDEIEHTRSEMRDTLDAIQNRLTPGQMMDDVMAYFREGPGAFASNFGRIVRDNPVPVALVGTGLAWLAMSGSRRQPRYGENEYDDESRYYYASAGGGDYVAATGAEYAAYTSTGGVHHPESSNTAGYTASVGAGYTGGGESSGQPYGGSSSDESYRRYQSQEEDQQGRVGRMAEGARERMGRFGGMAREQGQRAREGFAEIIEEQPLLMAGAAFVLGAALGALLPTTRREDKWMGETRDDLAHRAADAGREGMERAERAAGETWTAVSDEMLNRESSSGGGGSKPAERKAEHMTEQMSEPQSTTSSTSRRSSSSAAAGSSTAKATTTSGGSSNVKPGGAAGTTPKEGEKKT